MTGAEKHPAEQTEAARDYHQKAARRTSPTGRNYWLWLVGHDASTGLGETARLLR